MTCVEPAGRVAKFRRETKPQTQPITSRSRWSLEWIYFAIVMASWCFVPLLRRLLDWHNGYYNPVQITSILPLLLTLPLALISFKPERIARITPTFKFFAGIWFAAFAYGLLVAVAIGEPLGGIYEGTQYLVPMLAGIWLAGTDLNTPECMRRLALIVLTLAGIVAVYGIAQFVQPAPWDTLWIQGGQFLSMGDPVPFGLRIFSTLNSTGPAGDFFSVAMIFALPSCRLKQFWVLPFMALVGGALLLTLVRASWIALIVGVAVYLVLSPRRLLTLPVIVLFGILVSVLMTALPAVLGAGQNSDVITTRIATLGDISHDSSALARSDEINESLRQGLAYPVGEGLGQVGAASMMTGNPHAPFGNVVDSGYLARFVELGWLGFSGYMIVVVGSFVMMLATIMRPSGRDRAKSLDVMVGVSVAAAICAALLWSDAAGDSHLAFEGIFFWIALGIGLRRLPATVLRQSSARAKSGNITAQRQSASSLV